MIFILYYYSYSLKDHSLIVLFTQTHDPFFVALRNELHQVPTCAHSLLEGLHEQFLLIYLKVDLGLFEFFEDLQFAICCLLLLLVFSLLNVGRERFHSEAVHSITYYVVENGSLQLSIGEVTE